MTITVMETIGWKREVPEEEVLARIKADIEAAVAYDPSVTCWYLAQPVDKPDARMLGYYPYSFGGFVMMIERELDT